MTHPRPLRVLITIIVLTLGSLAVAQPRLYVPSDTPATGGTNAWPFSVFTNWRFQILVPASSLPPAPFKIVDLALAPTVTTLWSASDFQVRMAHTSNAVLDPCFDNNFDHPPCICYDGPMTWNATANTWSPLRLRCAFGYDGVRNVVIEIRYRGGPGGSVPLRYGGTQRSWRNSGSDAYSAPCRDGGGGGPKVCLTIDRSCVLHAPDTVSIGSNAPITIFQPLWPSTYKIINSFGQSPFFVNNCTFCLDVDPLFITSAFFPTPPIFNNYVGPVTSSAPVGGFMSVPNNPALVGYEIYSAALLYTTLSPLVLQCCTNTDGFRITL